jgi:hypothetical protein
LCQQGWLEDNGVDDDHPTVQMNLKLDDIKDMVPFTITSYEDLCNL